MEGLGVHVSMIRRRCLSAAAVAVALISTLSCRPIPEYTSVRHAGDVGNLVLTNGSPLVLCEVIERNETGGEQDLLLPGDVVLPGETREFQMSTYATAIRLHTCDRRIALEAPVARDAGLVVDYQLRTQTEPGRVPRNRRRD